MDSAQLLLQFGCLKAVIVASMDELCLCPGMGEKKVRRLHDAFHRSFWSLRETRAAADANYEENTVQEVSEAKGAPCNTASIKSGTKELEGANEGESNVVVKIEITRANQLLWNGEPVPDQRALEARLQSVAAQAEPPEVHIAPDRAARYDTVAAVLTASQRVGLQKVGVVGLEQFAP